MRGGAVRQQDDHREAADNHHEASRGQLLARSVAVVLSFTVLVVTGYGWLNYRHLLSGVATSEVGLGSSSDGSMDILLVDRKSTRLNSSHVKISYAVFCLKKNNITADRKKKYEPLSPY